jgi:hypothetical protein
MKTFKVTIQYINLVGTHLSEVEIRARTEASATKKAWQLIGNRDGVVVKVVPAIAGK